MELAIIYLIGSPFYILLTLKALKMKKITTLLMVVAMVFLSCETEPLNSDVINGVAAKGKVKKENVKSASSSSDNCKVNLLPNLPETVNACAISKPGNNSYFDLSIADGVLAGDYAAWCVDVAKSLNEGECFNANVYSSYEFLPDGVVDRPENFDLINWILNQDFVGTTSGNGSATYTLGDVQWAMWQLIDDTNCVSCTFLVPYDVTRATEIVDLAQANGEGYEPGEGDVLAVVLQPTDGKQVVIIPYLVECEPELACETAFARGTDGNTCFLDATPEFSRWGWTIGPLTEGDYTYDVWAAAGQCDTDKGELVGTVDVSYSAGIVTVTYNIDPAYTVEETHTYAGNAMFPTKNGNPTVAPGQYSIAEDLDGEIYVIAHAVVCK
jgi:hypothetical protein